MTKFGRVRPMRYGRARLDSSYNYYVIPEEELEEFDRLDTDTDFARFGTPPWFESMTKFHDRFFRAPYIYRSLFDIRVVIENV